MKKPIRIKHGFFHREAFGDIGTLMQKREMMRSRASHSFLLMKILWWIIKEMVVGGNSAHNVS